MSALIDCRDWESYCAGHIAGACSVPASELFARLHELPARNQTVQLCGTAADLAVAQAFLSERGYTLAPSIEWSNALMAQLTEQQQLEIGHQSTRFWQAAPLIERFVHDIMPRYHIQPENGLDIACGAGRDLVYLALQGWQMTGIDWSEDSLQRVASLAKHNQVTVSTQLVDLEATPSPLASYPVESVALICVARYLHRPLLPDLKRLLKPGGILIYQTFLQGTEKTAIGRPRNPKFLLAAGELAQTFVGYELLVDEIEYLPDQRPVSAFIARKPIR